MRSASIITSDDKKPRYGGVDGCRGGWIVATDDGRSHLCSTFAEVLGLELDHLAVDMPIGLPEPGQRRDCDALARRHLGRRASCVFPAPPRALLQARSFAEVSGHGLSIQAFNLFPKIAQVDRAMTAELQAHVHETHPELAFFRLAGKPMTHNKKKQEGYLERSRWLDFYPLEENLKLYRRSQVGRDDLVDAVALLDSARLQAEGLGRRLPEEPALDARGLRMEIWF